MTSGTAGRTHGHCSLHPRLLLDLVQPVDQAVDLLGDRVEVEARARRRGDAEARHQRLRAVVAGADGDALPVEDLGDVVRVDPGRRRRRRSRRGARRGGPKTRTKSSSASRPSAYSVSSCSCRSIASRPISREVVDRDAEAVRLGDRGRAGLELVRQLVPARPVERDRADHLAAEVERRHLLEQLRPGPRGRRRRSGPHSLCDGDGEEVAAERLHVDRAGAAPPAPRRRP